jgi:hypothetical protein
MVTGVQTCALPILQRLCGRYINARKCFSCETWFKLLLVKIEIRQDGIFAICSNEFNYNIDLDVFSIYEWTGE